MRRNVLAIILSAALLLGGCHARSPARPGWPVVSQISVTRRHEGAVSTQDYTSQDKMRQILNCLRDLGQKFTPAVDPDSLSGRVFTVSVLFSDGSSRLYETKSDLYVRFDGGPWQQADPKKLERLNLLLQSLPGDS